MRRKHYSICAAPGLKAELPRSSPTIIGGKIFFFFISAVILTLGLSAAFQSLLAAWSAPLANPSTCLAGNPGCDAPLNVGPLLQSKSGALWLNTNGISPLGLIVENGKVGIGTVAPVAKLQSSGAAATASPTLGAATGGGFYLTNTDSAYGLLAGVSGSGDVWLQAQRTDASPTAYNLLLQPSGGNVVIGGGTGKITAGTFDPVYNINGINYATYLPGMTGQKEETTGVVNCELKQGRYEYAIDFNSLAEGTDLWLFAKITSLKSNLDRLTVILTPSFSGQVWYEKDVKNNLLLIVAEPTDVGSDRVEISYRLTAPRFDAADWPNRAREGDGNGFLLNE